MAEPRTAGVIHDLGYQRYNGERLGRGHATWQLLKFSFRTAYGLDRGTRARLGPSAILLIVFFPAIVQVGVASFTGMTQLINYAGYLEFTGVLLALFTATQAPELLVTDRQHGVLSLYMSRPLRGTDYALAKLGALVGAMLVLTLGPQLFLFLGKVFISPTPWPAFLEEWRKLVPIVGGTLATSCYMASIGLALSSFAARRAYATAGVIAFFLLASAGSAIFHDIAGGDIKRYAVLVHPVWLITGFANWLFDIEARRRSTIGRADLPPETFFYALLAFVAVGVVILLLRYRRSEL